MCGPDNNDKGSTRKRGEILREFVAASEENLEQKDAAQISEILKPSCDVDEPILDPCSAPTAEKAARTLWNAQIFGETLRQQEAAALLKGVEGKHQARLQSYAAEHLELVREQVAAFASAGIDLSQHVEVRYARDLTPEQRAGLLLCPPTLVVVPNGESHKAGKDCAGLYLVPWDAVAGAKLQEDMLSAVEFIPSGTALVAALAVIQRAKGDIEAKQKSQFIRLLRNGNSGFEAPPGGSSPAPKIV